MEKYRKEYFEVKDRLATLKKEIQEILEKYEPKEYPFTSNKLMDVLHELYKDRKGEDRDDYAENILENYREDCGVPYEDLASIMELFIERKIARRRIGFIKGFIVRNFIYHGN